MNKLCKLLDFKNQDILFQHISSTFKEKITTWSYFVNWEKVIRNIDEIKIELNLLNSLIVSRNIESDVEKLILKYPEVVKAFPYLIAIREKNIDVLVDTKKFIYQNYSFSKKKTLTNLEATRLKDFFIQSGISLLIEKKRVSSFVDYVTGVEVGLDSNGRKNRGGTLMESIVENFVTDTCQALDVEYMPQATAKKIKNTWGIDVKVDKSSRNVDFAINQQGKLYFIECNFYGGGGSKLKSTASEYIHMNSYWNEQNIEFIWITDGAGWKSTLKPLREYFDKSDYLLNLALLESGFLTEIIKNGSRSI